MEEFLALEDEITLIKPCKSTKQVAKTYKNMQTQQIRSQVCDFANPGLALQPAYRSLYCMFYLRSLGATDVLDTADWSYGAWLPKRKSLNSWLIL